MVFFSSPLGLGRGGPILAWEAKKRFRRVIKSLLSREMAAIWQQVWSIGIYVGESPFHLASPEDIDNPILKIDDIFDVPAHSIADPFMLRVDRTWYLFFEVLNLQTGKGVIGLAISENGLKWTYEQIVLSEPFHLSYPYVFEWMNDYYMVPETFEAGSIRLYKASKFPTEWSFVGILKSGEHFADASLFRYHSKWWLFTETNPEMRNDTLRLFHAPELIGPWIEHPDSPIIEGNPHIARPAGRVIVVDDKVIRYTQDCHPAYGTQVRGFEINELTTRTYREQKVDQTHLVLTPSGIGWNASGMHHIDPHLMDDGRWIAAVDGCHYGYMDIVPRLKKFMISKFWFA
jgi:hypothetical protein